MTDDARERQLEERTQRRLAQEGDPLIEVRAELAAAARAIEELRREVAHVRWQGQTVEHFKDVTEYLRDEVRGYADKSATLSQMAALTKRIDHLESRLDALIAGLRSKP